MNDQLSIYIVTDQSEIAQRITACLSSLHGHQIDTVIWPAKGAAMPGLGVADVCVVDMGSVDQDGLARFVAWATEHQTVPLIALLHKYQEAQASEYLAQGVDDFLFEGEISSSVLLRSLRYCLENRKLRTSLGDLQENIESINEGQDSVYSEQQLLDNITDICILLDPGGEVRYANQPALAAFPELGGRRRPVLWDVLPDHAASFARQSRITMEEGRFHKMEDCETHSGKCYHVRIYPSDKGAAVFLTDISELKRIEAAMKEQVMQDRLTGLGNRQWFEDQITQLVRHPENPEAPILAAVLLVDLGRFKTINDTLGHRVGDTILKEVGRRLATHLDDNWQIARFGGDEFLVLLPAPRDEQVIEQAAHRVMLVVRDQINVREHAVHLTVNIGSAIALQDGSDAGTLIQHAELALRAAKRRGASNYQPYGTDMHQTVAHMLRLESDLPRALAQGEFEVYYQPILSMKGEGMRAEALMRWNHPELGVVMPGDFISLCEETGAIVPLTEWLLHSVCSDIAQWKQSGLPIQTVSVNISPRHFVKENFVSTVLSVIGQYEVDPAALQVEITESMAMFDVEATTARLEALRKNGILVAIDDFGTGHASLNHLKNLPLDQLKIDRSFVAQCTEDRRDAAIIKAIITMAHALGLEVCAEGIETKEQWHLLKSLNCNKGQGYLLGRPMPTNAFASFLAAA